MNVHKTLCTVCIAQIKIVHSPQCTPPHYIAHGSFPGRASRCLPALRCSVIHTLYIALHNPQSNNATWWWCWGNSFEESFFLHFQPTNLFPVYCASGLACPTIGGDPSPSARQVRRVFSVSQWHRGGLCQQESPPYVRGHFNFGQILGGTPEVLSYLHFQDRAPDP